MIVEKMKEKIQRFLNPFSPKTMNYKLDKIEKEGIQNGLSDLDIIREKRKYLEFVNECLDKQLKTIN